MDSINKLNETGGAGDWGTDKARARLQKDTPGQEITKGKKMKTFKDVLQGIDEAYRKPTAAEIKKDKERERKASGKSRSSMSHSSAKKNMYGKMMGGLKDEVQEENYAQDLDLAQKNMARLSQKETGQDKKDYQAVARALNQGNLGAVKKVIKGISTEEIQADILNVLVGYNALIAKMYPKATDSKGNLKSGMTVSKLIAEGTEVVQEAMSERDKKKRLAMIKKAVEKINKQNADKAKKDALAMMKASGMFDEDVDFQESIEEVSFSRPGKGERIVGDSKFEILKYPSGLYSINFVNVRDGDIFIGKEDLLRFQKFMSKVRL